jgi:hypothetical protein
MSRSGYTEDLDNWQMIKWRGMVASATRGKRGQACLREMLAALDSMPEKALIIHELELEGDVCALGALGKARGVDMSKLDPEEPESVAAVFNIATPLAQEIVYHNDEGGSNKETPEERWKRMRSWVTAQIRETANV